MDPDVIGPVRTAFRALAETLVPEAAELDAAGWSELERIVVDGLAANPPALRRRLLLFIRILELLPVVRFGRRFTRLDPDRRARFLDGVQRSRVLLLRRGAWGLKTVVLMGYYGRPAAAAEIGYRADPRGWEARR